MRRKFKFKRADKSIKVKEFRANNKIIAEKVFLIDENGDNIGVISTTKALEMAEDAGLDLVEVNPKADIPVAKLLDLGQFKYEQDKKAHKQKALQKKVEVKNIRVSFRISKHDLGFRLEQAFKFLSKGNKVKIDMNLRGREKQHSNRAREMMIDFFNSLKQKGDLKIEEEQPLTKQPGGFTITLVNKK